MPSLQHLIAMKLHAIRQNPTQREPKDLQDIFELIAENGVNVQEKSFRELCLKYGTQELYQKIVGHGYAS